MGRTALVLVPLCAAVAAAGVGSCGREPETAASPAASSDGPDFVLVSIDSLRADHLSCYGHDNETSPRIDRLAAEGVLFESAVSTTSWTLPAHAALFTGLWDSAHGLVDNGLRLAAGHVTLAEALARAGYHTAGFYGGPYLHPTFGLDQGFEVWTSCMTTVPEALSDDEVRAESRAHRAAAHADVTGPRTLEEVTRWADGAARSGRRPYFLFVHLWDVHYDYLAPPEYVERFDPGYDGPISGRDFLGDPAIHPGMSERDRNHLLALYDAEIRFTDDVLGRMLDALEARGLLDDAWVIVTADHGEEFFEHGMKGHQKTLYDEVVRVPLVVRGPRGGAASGSVAPGTVVGQQVRLVDLAPTIAELAGLERAPPFHGRSLVPLLRGGKLPPAPALCELMADGRDFRALRTDALKLHEYPGTPRGDLRMAFDLARDPGEARSLPPQRADLAPAWEELARLRAQARELREALGGGGAEAIELDPDLRERLRELGYLGEGAGGAESGERPR